MLHERAGSNATTFQGGLKRDCGHDGAVFAERLLPSGEGMLLADFVSHENSQEAKLLEAHVAALRLYTTAVYQSINNPPAHKFPAVH